MYLFNGKGVVKRGKMTVSSNTELVKISIVIIGWNAFCVTLGINLFKSVERIYKQKDRVNAVLAVHLVVLTTTFTTMIFLFHTVSVKVVGCYQSLADTQTDRQLNMVLLCLKL